MKREGPESWCTAEPWRSGRRYPGPPRRPGPPPRSSHIQISCHLSRPERDSSTSNARTLSLPVLAYVISLDLDQILTAGARLPSQAAPRPTQWSHTRARFPLSTSRTLRYDSSPAAKAAAETGPAAAFGSSKGSGGYKRTSAPRRRPFRNLTRAHMPYYWAIDISLVCASLVLK